jgi:hydroxymethylglutaryl-CoA lyase
MSHTSYGLPHAGSRIAVNEVAPRDGLQNECVFVPTQDKIDWIDTLSQQGYAKIEVTSFTSPSAIPALRDAEQVMRSIRRTPGIVYTALVPNVRGAERAIDARTDEFNLVMSASQTHNLANLRMTQEQSLQGLAQVAHAARQARIPVNISLSCAFGCPMEGELAAAEVLDWVARLADLGVQGITLCDTTGMADPGQVLALCSAAIARASQVHFTAHFHDTRGLAGANVFAALQAGIRSFDASLGGIGGCPYAPGASGNVATEDLVHLLACLGLDCGLSLTTLASLADRLQSWVGRELPSAVRRAGPRWQRHAPPADFEGIRSRALARQQGAMTQEQRS